MKKLFLSGICFIFCYYSNAQRASQSLVSDAAFQSTTVGYTFSKTSASILAGSILNVAENKAITTEKNADNFTYNTRESYTKLTSKFIYNNESGALCEGFNNIFESGIELAGRTTTDKAFSSTLSYMSNPNESSQPDTYKGIYWYTGSNDNGGVHTNSGVLNFWFFLLSNGGNGTNDKAVKFNVTGLGYAKAHAIAYRTLNSYLQSASDYKDARIFSIMAAEDLFGKTSPEVTQTINAWNAVGVDTDVLITKTSSLYDIPADVNPINAYTVITNHITVNPSNNQLIVELVDKKPAIRNITVNDTNDKIIYSNDVKTVQGNNRLQINLPSLADGTYVLKVDNVHSGIFPVKH